MSTKAPNPVDRYVGSRGRMRRIMLGMSQEKLGDALGLTFQQVQKYEEGTNRVGASRIQQISEILRSRYRSCSREARADHEREGQRGNLAGLRLRFSGDLEGLALTRAFARIAEKLRRSIVGWSNRSPRAKGRTSAERRRFG